MKYEILNMKKKIKNLSVVIVDSEYLPRYLGIRFFMLHELIHISAYF